MIILTDDVDALINASSNPPLSTAINTNNYVPYRSNFDPLNKIETSNQELYNSIKPIDFNLIPTNKSPETTDQIDISKMTPENQKKFWDYYNNGYQTSRFIPGAQSMNGYYLYKFLRDNQEDNMWTPETSLGQQAKNMDAVDKITGNYVSITGLIRNNPITAAIDGIGRPIFNYATGSNVPDLATKFKNNGLPTFSDVNMARFWKDNPVAGSLLVGSYVVPSGDLLNTISKTGTWLSLANKINTGSNFINTIGNGISKIGSSITHGIDNVHYTVDGLGGLSRMLANAGIKTKSVGGISKLYNEYD